MIQPTWRSTLALAIVLSASVLAGEPEDQGPVILGMDDWVDDGSLGGPFSGVTNAEQEPNNGATTADAIEVGDNYTGSISPGSDFDFASFQISANQVVSFETISGGGSLGDTTLSLMDVDGTTELEFDDDDGVGLYSRIDYTFAVAGTYYIKCGSYGNGTGSYLLHVRTLSDLVPLDGWAYIQKALEAMAPAVFVPNDGSVAVVGCADSVATSENAGAAYHYSIPAAAENAPELSGVANFYNGASGVNAFFSDLSQGLVHPAIIVLPGTGATNSLDVAEGAALVSHAHEIGDFIGAGGGLLSHGDEDSLGVAYDWIPAVFPRMSVGIAANDPNFTDEGFFTLPGMRSSYIASGGQGFFLDHGMSVLVEAPGVSVPGPFSGITITEQEPNDGHTAADAMALGDDYTGSITIGSDYDYVAFAVVAGDEIIAETISGGSLSDTTLTLYSTNGTTQLAYDDDGGENRLSKLEYAFSTAGTYFLKVGSYSAGTGSYHMQLRKMLPPAPLAVVVGTIPGPWRWEGNALAGSQGNPLLQGVGELTAGSPFSLDLTRARQNSSAMMVLGYWEEDLPFKGGLMVPNPGVVIPLQTDINGAITISGTRSPSSAPGVTLFLQYWIQDGTGPEGFSASNGLSFTTQ